MLCLDASTNIGFLGEYSYFESSKFLHFFPLLSHFFWIPPLSRQVQLASYFTSAPEFLSPCPLIILFFNLILFLLLIFSSSPKTSYPLLLHHPALCIPSSPSLLSGVAFMVAFLFMVMIGMFLRQNPFMHITSLLCFYSTWVTVVVECWPKSHIYFKLVGWANAPLGVIWLLLAH